MPTDDRIVFVLKHLEGYRYQQIASCMDCSLSTVKRRIRRANSRFKKGVMKDSVFISLLEENDAF
jgi:RNA polymerase sigma-70 factor (ECF subfamily)